MNHATPAGTDAAARAFVAFGANLGNPVAAYEEAINAMANLEATRVVRPSALYRSSPVGVSGQPDYLNAVVELQTQLTAAALLQALMAIEQRAGRTRESHRAPRTMDLDLLLYDQQVIRQPGLEVPHPRMHERAFVLVPLTEIAADIHVPGHGPACNLLTCVGDQDITRL